MKKIIKKTLAEQVYSALRSEIIEQNIPCGEKLNLNVLEERFNVSSSPLREAINRLYQDGLLEYYTNIGAKVIDIKEKDIEEIYDFYCELDCISLKFAVKNASYEEIVKELEENLVIMKEILETNNLSNFNAISDDFHNILYKFADNSRLLSAAKQIRSQFTILSTKYQNVAIIKSIVYDEHKQICDALKDQNLNKAIKLMESHFSGSKNYLLNHINELKTTKEF